MVSCSLPPLSPLYHINFLMASPSPPPPPIPSLHLHLHSSSPQQPQPRPPPTASSKTGELGRRCLQTRAVSWGLLLTTISCTHPHRCLQHYPPPPHWSDNEHMLLIVVYSLIDFKSDDSNNFSFTAAYHNFLSYNTIQLL